MDVYIPLLEYSPQTKGRIWNKSISRGIKVHCVWITVWRVGRNSIGRKSSWQRTDLPKYRLVDTTNGMKSKSF